MSRRTRPVDPDAQPGTTEDIAILASHDPEAVHESFRPDNLQAPEDEFAAISYKVNGRVFYCGKGTLNVQQGKYADPKYTHDDTVVSAHLTKIVARSGPYSTADALDHGELHSETVIWLCFELPNGTYRVKATDTDRLDAIMSFPGTKPKLPP